MVRDDYYQICPAIVGSKEEVVWFVLRGSCINTGDALADTLLTKYRYYIIYITIK